MYMNCVDVWCGRFQREISAMQAKMGVLEDFQFRVSREDFDLSWNVVRYPQYIAGQSPAHPQPTHLRCAALCSAVIRAN
jgi:hypothetical protein